MPPLVCRTAARIIIETLPAPLKGPEEAEAETAARGAGAGGVDGEALLLTAARAVVLINGDHTCAWNVRKRHLHAMWGSPDDSAGIRGEGIRPLQRRELTVSTYYLYCRRG